MRVNVGDLALVYSIGMARPILARVTFERVGDNGLRYLSWRHVGDGSRAPGFEPRGEALAAEITPATFTNLRAAGFGA